MKNYYPRKFYAELKELRDRRGEVEYSRDEIRPDVEVLLTKHGTDGKNLLTGEADRILDNAEHSDDSAAQGFLSFDAHVRLGEKRRIKRGAMIFDQLHRRKRVIDHNKKNQDASWAFETDWINERMDLLRDQPPTTKVRDVDPGPIEDAAD